MDQGRWSSVDPYIEGVLAPSDPALDAAIEASQRAGLPPIQVSPAQGKLLYLLAIAIRARTILGFGTLGGYSAIWLARALPADGRLVTLEADPAYAAVAGGSIRDAGLGDTVDVRVGPALELLPELAAEGIGPFDLTFIDADKEHSPDYFMWALERSRPGALIIADNVVRGGGLADPNSSDAKVRAQRRLHEMIAADQRVSGTSIQTVGDKGYDGFTLAVVER